MNTIRRQETERRVAPIDGGQRPRVRQGIRREAPADQERPPVDGRESRRFEEELARQQEEADRAGPAMEPPVAEAAPLEPVDRLDIRGREAASGEEAEVVRRRGKTASPETGQHLDLRV
ncbi:MAG: hypothetical protein Q8O14_05780 [bacterium]|jgi:hypothetical protein|nr:hypothetical protein [bacterium]